MGSLFEVEGSTGNVETSLVQGKTGNLILQPLPSSGDAVLIKDDTGTTVITVQGGVATLPSTAAVISIYADSNPTLTGSVQLVSGTNITLSQTGNAITINSTGGGGGSPGGSDMDVQFNEAGAFAGDGILQYNYNTNTLSVGTGNITTGYINVNEFTTTRYFTINGASSPGVSSAGNGNIYFDSGTNHFLVSENTGAYVPLLGSPVSSITGTADEVLVNGTSGSPVTGAITLTTPQAIGTTSTPTFAGLDLTTSGGTSSITFNNGTNTFSMGFSSTGEFTISGAAGLTTPQFLNYFYSGSELRIGDGVALIISNSGTIPVAQGLSIQSGFNLIINGGDLNLRDQSGINFEDTSSLRSVLMQAPSTITSSYTLNLPLQQGAGALQNDGSGNLSFGLINASATSQTSSIGTTTLFTPTATGTYRVSIYIVDIAGTVFTLQGTVGWTDSATAQTATTSTLTNATNGYVQSSFFVEATSGNPVTYAVALTGTATYNVYVVSERLS